MSNEVFPILIVDDEPNIRTGLARALECESYAIATAGDAGEALRQFRITHHPLVLTDLKMPGASTGIDLIPKMACNIGLMFNPNFFACLGVFHLAIEHVFLAQRHCDCRCAESAAISAGRLGARDGVRRTADAARRAPPSPEPARAPDLLLDGLAVLHTEGYTAGAPMLKRALWAFRSDELSREDGIGWLWLACRTAMDLWDDESWFVLSARQIQLARDAGALTVLPLALNLRAGIDLFAGQFAAAETLSEEAHAVSDAIANPHVPHARLFLAAWRGHLDETLRLTAAGDRDATARGEGRTIGVGKYATAVLNNGLARYDDALDAARQTTEYPQDLAFFAWGLVELIEASARSGNAALAADGLRRLSELTRVSRTDWALGVEARSRALLSEGEVSERLYDEAIERLGRTRVRVELARAHLLYGEWLRRERRRLDAREQLRHAHELFTQFGMEAFAERARVELEATGEHARKRTVETRDDLTPQEAQVSRLAADGATNQEIAAQLFISPSTVDYHLRKAFRKLGVKSRHQLNEHLI